MIGFVDEMIALVDKSGAAGVTMMFALVGVTLLVVVASGSGNAAFYAFVEIAPKMAAKLGINPAYLILPMQQASNVGRTLSPVSGVIVRSAARVTSRRCCWSNAPPSRPSSRWRWWCSTR